MGNKSKFTFPVPGRSSKQHSPPQLSIATPLSKAQKVLGASGVNTETTTHPKNYGRSWEETSNSGISISISESSASQSTAETGYGGFDDEDTPGTSYSRGIWEQESEVIPRQLRSAHGRPSSSKQSLKPKRSAATIGNDYRDTATDDSYARRRMSAASSVWSHYDSGKMPLSISQQTSNSAMAKGLPTKASSLLDMDGALAGLPAKKKKPARLDLSKWSWRSKSQVTIPPSSGVGPVLGNNYVMRSPSFMSQSTESSPSREDGPRAMRKLTWQPPNGTLTVPDARRESRGQPRGARDNAGLHQLYSHYEQMSFRDSPLEEEEEPEEQFNPDYLQPQSTRIAPNVSAHDLVTSSVHSSGWKHSRESSHDSKATTRRADTPNTSQLLSSAKKDYTASVSSRHTRTSKASPSTRSILESDRQQNSVLSLSDSSDEEDIESPPVTAIPARFQTHRDDVSVSSSRSHLSADRVVPRSQGPGHQNENTSSHLDDHLVIPKSVPTPQGGRSVSNASRSSNNSASTFKSKHPSSPSSYNPRYSKASVLSYETMDSVAYSRQHGFGVQEARTVSFLPLASTSEAASGFSVPQTPSNFDQIILRQTTHGGSNQSRASDQPTPPLSPNSVEFSVKPPGPAHKEPSGPSDAEEQHARMMAVTKQEEMLLAALRKKRARMRENIIAELDQDRSSRSSYGSGNTGSDKRMSVHNPMSLTSREEDKDRNAGMSKPIRFPQRSSSLTGRPAERRGHARHNNNLQGIQESEAPSTSHSDPISDRPPRLPPVTMVSEQRSRSKTKPERVLLYLDQPLNGAQSIDTSEPSPDLSDYMDSDNEIIPDERRSRTRSRYGSGFPAYTAKRDSEHPRPDSTPFPALRDVPEVELDDDDYDEDDLDVSLDDFHMISQAHGQQLREKSRGMARPDSPVDSPGLLHPKSAKHRAKKSDVRLSAVGYASGPMPYWGDDD
ncbi:hypothetical protein F5Y15DRAFT_273049 [Xylariaceae sp. FL0016]|nr:hypothetical protein F5Y15DRAFT_273049 [Xylariaceae sp. FL0016]